MVKKQLLKSALIVMAAGLMGASSAHEVKNIDAELYFSPKGGAQNAIVRTITHAKKSVCVAAYHFDNEAIAEALVVAVRQGVEVRVLMDKKGAKEGKKLLQKLEKAGMTIRVDGSHNRAHNKVMVIDNKKVVTGSYNFNEVAERENAENLLILKSEELARLYSSDWSEHWSHAKKF